MVAALAGTVVGCGGERQDAHEPSGTYTVSVLHQSFPRVQKLAHTEQLVLVVRNDSAKTVPNLAVSIDSFSTASQTPGLANPQRPVWILDVGPGASPTHGVEGNAAETGGGAQTAYVNTWALGPLRPHAIRLFRWRVTPVAAGLHRVTYTVAAGLNGKARAELADGAVPRGSFTVYVSPTAAQTHVDPNTGAVVPGPPPQAP